MGNFFIGFPVPRAKIAEMVEGYAPPLAHVINHLPLGSDPIIEAMGYNQVLVWNPGEDKFETRPYPTAGSAGVYADRNLFFHSCFQTLDGWEEYTNYDGSVTLDGYMVFLRSSTTSRGYARIMKYLKYGICPMSWTKERKFRVRARLRALSNKLGIIEIITGLTGNQTHFGFRIVDGEIYGISYYGSESITESLTVLGTGAYDEVVNLEAIFKPGDKITFNINESDYGDIQTNLPEGQDVDFVAVNLIVDNDYNAKDISIQTSEIKFFQAV